MAQDSDISAVWPARKASGSNAVRIATWGGLGLAAAAATWFVLPAGSFQAKSIISVGEATSPVSAILTRTAAEVAVSKPVMTRAAESLIGTGFPAPEPDVAERAALAAHIGGVKATGKTARLADELPRLVTARPGETLGTLDIVASAGNPERAAQAASAVADAIIANQEERIASSRRKHELDVAARLDRLKADVASARLRLTHLGGFEADPMQTIAAAVSQTARAQSRVNVIHAIISSGSPPLSDRRDVPSAIETLQATYLDLTRQLAKARETLGERHTTIIALSAELRHASASLSAEWRRLERMAQTELSVARDREASLGKAASGADAARRGAIEQARRGVQLADENLARALAAGGEAAADERGYRVLLHPTVPAVATGFGPLMRGLLSGLAGLSVIGIGMAVRRRKHAAGGDLVASGEHDVSGPVVLDLAVTRTPDPHATSEDERAVHPQGQALDRSDRSAPPVEDGAAAALEGEAALAQAMIELMPQIEIIDPAFGPIPTVMVAANEATADTTTAVLALGRAAAGRGHRVLLIEATRSRPKLAAAADTEADPILIDFFGTLRVALPAVEGNDAIFLAPNLQQGARIASALASAGDAPLVDDLGAEFDLVLIDGGRAADAVAAGWGADAYLRVGRYRSKRDDEVFAAALGASATEILGAIVDSSIAEAAQKSTSSVARVPRAAARPIYRASALDATSASSQRYAPQRRKIGSR